MLCTHTLILGASLLLQTPPAAPELTPDEFQHWFHTAARGDLDLPPAVERRARQFRYVIVAGFNSERLGGYFAPVARELKARGVPPGAIHYITPSSHETFEGNRDAIRERFRAIAARGPEPLVVIAHSRGASDALAFALENAEFVRDHVAALFLVQGAFGGSGAADYVLGEGSLMDWRMPLRLRLLAYGLGKLERFRVHRGKHEGLEGLTRAESDRFWDRMLEEHAGAVPVVGPKTFYITSRIDPARLRLFRRAIALYLQTYYGPNDGMVALRDQSLPGLGTCLGVFEAAHSDLTHRIPSTHAPRLRKALVDSILMAVGRTGDEPGTSTGTNLRRPRHRLLHRRERR